LRELVAAITSWRMKTDKTVIADLPEKTEVKAYCPATPSSALQRSPHPCRQAFAGGQ